MFQQANSAAAGQLPAQAQFFLQNQVRENFHIIFTRLADYWITEKETFVAGTTVGKSDFNRESKFQRGSSRYLKVSENSNGTGRIDWINDY